LGASIRFRGTVSILLSGCARIALFDFLHARGGALERELKVARDLNEARAEAPATRLLDLLGDAEIAQDAEIPRVTVLALEISSAR
jgi:hypothetical protein